MLFGNYSGSNLEFGKGKKGRLKKHIMQSKGLCIKLIQKPDNWLQRPIVYKKTSLVLLSWKCTEISCLIAGTTKEWNKKMPHMRKKMRQSMAHDEWSKIWPTQCVGQRGNLLLNFFFTKIRLSLYQHSFMALKHKDIS